MTSIATETAHSEISNNCSYRNKNHHTFVKYARKYEFSRNFSYLIVI